MINNNDHKEDKKNAANLTRQGYQITATNKGCQVYKDGVNIGQKTILPPGQTETKTPVRTFLRAGIEIAQRDANAKQLGKK